MPYRNASSLTESEELNFRRGYDIWERILASESYCMSKAEEIPRYPSDAALLEATALVKEQISVTEIASTVSPQEPQENEDTKREKIALLLSENAFIEHYALQVYQAHIFYIWHVAKSSGMGPERLPTPTERLRFERQFYHIWKLVVVPEQKFNEIATSFALADLVRLENLLKYFVTHCHDNHTLLVNIFHTSKAREALLRLQKVRDAKASSSLGTSARFQTDRGFTILDTWSIFDEIQGQINSQFPDDPNRLGTLE